MDYIHMQMNSETAKIPLPLDILVPRKTVRGPYKTLYLLHDLAGNNTQWMRTTQIEALMEGDRTVLVMPSCLNSFYVNMYYGSDFLDYITQELVYLCGKWLNLDQRREKRVIAGIGMGGYGALSAALRAPGVFGAAFSIDGLLQPGRFYDQPLPGLKMEDLFGPQGYYEQSPNQLVNAAEQIKRNPIFQEFPEMTLCSSREDSFREEAEELYQNLAELGYETQLYTDAEDAVRLLAEKVREL